MDLTNKDRKQVIKAVQSGEGVINMVVRRRKSLAGRIITPIEINLTGHKGENTAVNKELMILHLLVTDINIKVVIHSKRLTLYLLNKLQRNDLKDWHLIRLSCFFFCLASQTVAQDWKMECLFLRWLQVVQPPGTVFLLLGIDCQL